MNDNFSNSNDSKESTVSIRYTNKRKCSFENSNIVSNNIQENYPLNVNQSMETHKSVRVNIFNYKTIKLNYLNKLI
jgi:hypothetical protein